MKIRRDATKSTLESLLIKLNMVDVLGLSATAEQIEIMEMAKISVWDNIDAYYQYSLQEVLKHVAYVNYRNLKVRIRIL